MRNESVRRELAASVDSMVNGSYAGVEVKSEGGNTYFLLRTMFLQGIGPRILDDTRETLRAFGAVLTSNFDAGIQETWVISGEWKNPYE